MFGLQGLSESATATSRMRKVRTSIQTRTTDALSTMRIKEDGNDDPKLHSSPFFDASNKNIRVFIIINFLVLCYTSILSLKKLIQRLELLRSRHPEPNNDFDISRNKLLELDSAKDWYPLGSIEYPYTPMAPQLDVVWARGWYNALPPPQSVPIDYYNRAGMGGEQMSNYDMEKFFPSELCGGNFWIRTVDLRWWIANRLDKMSCNFTLITGDAIYGVPDQISKATEILDHPNLQMWYAQNVLMEHPKLSPIPLGLPIHYGYPDSPDSAQTVDKMIDIREKMPSWQNRSRRILFDRGTMTSGARKVARKQALEDLSACNDSRVEFMTQTPTLETWEKHYSTHQFAIVVRGTGWDTYRTWEYLFFGTVPILLKGTPMDHLHMPAHTPVVFVDHWKDICYWDDEFYAELEARYEHWIANAHKWLQPSLWVPRNQTEMERLCDISPGCRDEPLYIRAPEDAMDGIHYE